MAEVPDLPCRKCGHVTTMRYCWPAPWDWWPVRPNCIRAGEHMHRECGRCGFKWITEDVLSEPAARATRFDAEAAWWAEKGEPRLAERCREKAAAERAEVAS